MPSRPRHNFLRRSLRLKFSDAYQLARQHPDAVVRNLLHLPRNLKSHEQRREMWQLFKNLAGDLVLRRAGETLKSSRVVDELEAILQAATEDEWTELGPVIAQRLHREIHHLQTPATPPSSRANAVDPQRLRMLRALAEAAGHLNAPLSAEDVRVLLKHSSARLKIAGAQLAARENREDLLDDCLPLCWESGEAALFAGELVARVGQADHAAQLWTHVLKARKTEQINKFRHLIHVLSEMGAFDIQVALRVWIEEDFANPETCAWNYARPWSRLVAAKLAAGISTRTEALEELHWFVTVAGGDTSRGFGGYGAERGPFYLARQFVLLGESAPAETLLKRYSSCGLPPPAEFPELLFASLKPLDPNSNNGDTVAWLAALGDSAAQEKLIERWLRAFAEARHPEHWNVRRFLDTETVLAVLRQALRTREPGVLRQILGLLMSDTSAQNLTTEIETLATKHSSAVVRWKAKRLLQCMQNNRSPQITNHDLTHRMRWVRIDAAVLSGALRATPVRRSKQPRSVADKTGILLPLRADLGYRLEFENLSPIARRATELALCNAPLHHALERRVPQGPAYEDRPDIRTLRELAPPKNEIDERMMELAEAVRSYWSDSDDMLTLDEDGVALVATGLCADMHSLGEDDVTACGAFIGEVLRKRLGGEWSGYDEHYVLNTATETLDPIGWVRDIYQKKDIVEGTRILIQSYQDAIAKLTLVPPRKRHHPDPTKAIEETLHQLNSFPTDTNMADLLAAARALTYRLDETEWAALLIAMEPLFGDSTGVRTFAAIAVYAPNETFAKAWARWGPRRREESGLQLAIAQAMSAAADRDDLEAMPDWTAQPLQSRFSFLNPLRKCMDNTAWKKVLLLLLRQRAIAGDRHGVAWCLYSFKYEFPDSLTLVQVFCDLSVSARQTVLRASFHATRAEKRLFRPLWAEALRDPSDPVVMAALSAISLHQARSLMPLVEALIHDPREQVAAAAADLIRAWE